MLICVPENSSESFALIMLLIRCICLFVAGNSTAIVNIFLVQDREQGGTPVRHAYFAQN